MEVDVEVEPAAEVLDHRHRPRSAVGEALPFGAAPVASRWAARSVIRRPPQLGQKPRPLQEQGTSRSRAQPSQRSRTKPWARMPQVRNSRNSRPKMDTQTQGLGRAARSIRCRAVRRLRVIQPDLGRRAIRASRRPARARCVPSGAPGARFPCRPKPTITTRAVQPNGAPTTARAHIRRYARRHGNCAAAGPSR